MLRGRSALVLAFLLTATSATAETVVPGGFVSGTWGLAGSPYLVQGNISIHSVGTLTVEPGVEVIFQGAYSLTVAGILHAQGTVVDSVHFTAADTAAGWRGIRFENAPEGNIVSFCALQYARSPFEPGGAISCVSSNVEITRCRLAHNRGTNAGAVYIDGGSPEISYCDMIENQADGNGGAIYIYFTSAFPGPSITNCTFLDNSAGNQGGAIGLNHSEAAIAHCTIAGGTANFGGAIACNSSTPTVDDCIITGNVSLVGEGGGIWCQFSDPSVSYCLMTGNVGGGTGGGAIYVSGGSGPEIDHCTVDGNSAATGAAIRVGLGGTVDITNTIISFHTGEAVTATDSITVFYSDYYGNDIDGAGTGPLTRLNANGDSCDARYNIYLDPVYVDRLGDDYHIEGSSPCKDAGDPTSPHDPDFTVTDMGVYYFDQSATSIHVPGDEPTIEAGLAAASVGDSVIVSCGTYYERELIIPEGILLRSETGDPDCVTIDAQVLGRVLFFPTPSARSVDPPRVEGITIYGGYASGVGLGRHGGGAYCAEASAPVFENVIFTGNEAQSDGGGLYCIAGAAPELTACAFTENFAGSSGGGMACWSGSSAIVTDCLFSGNRATAGGAIRCYASSPTLVNCTIAGNLAWGGGGIQCAENSSPTLEKTILWGNCAQDEGDDAKLVDAGSSLTLSCSDADTNKIAGLGSVLWQAGSLVAEPLFCDPAPCESAPTTEGDYSLWACSPCMDAPGCGRLGALGAGDCTREWTIAADGSGDAPTIQAGIDSACDRDTVVVGPGTYAERLDFAGNNIVLGSLFLITGDTSYISQTVLDGGGAGPVVEFDNGEDSSAAFVGFTVRNGSAMSGGGIECTGSDPLISHCTVVENYASSSGGGIYLSGASPRILDCLITDNKAGKGGGIRMGGDSSPYIANCTVRRDSAETRGGGIYIWDLSSVEPPVFSSCNVSDNHAELNGGGIYCYASDFLFEDGVISENIALDDAGGIWLSGAEGTFSHSTISANRSFGSFGGGIHAVYSNPTLSYCIVEGNQAETAGGGIYTTASVRAQTTVDHCDFIGNTAGLFGSGIMVAQGSWLLLSNSILEGHSGSALYLDVGSGSNVGYNDFYGNDDDVLGLGAPPALGVPSQVNSNGDSCDAFYNILLDPLFVDPEGGDYHLQGASPCVDAGDPLSPRDPDDTVADMGVFFLPQWTSVGPENPRPAGETTAGIYPNPFRGTATVRYSLPVKSDVVIEIHDVHGRKVALFTQEDQSSGVHEFAWHPAGLAPGTYFCSVRGESFSRTTKIILVR